ncbi:MAG: hypothetical protein KUA33_05325, partial [Methanobacterium sp.]|nr:hypothetical protein [Euryarchaeota archaeon]MBV1729649.1 hypothetical protein [Methanobacterium sp.]
MDEKGYVFSPIAVLILIPVLVIAINFGEIVNESNTLASIAIGGDVTYNTAQNIFSIIEKSSADAGRNSAYNATRKVIDDNKIKNNTNPFFPNGTSKQHIRQNIVNSLNVQLIDSCKELERQTGREIFINNIPINNYTNQTLLLKDVTISQDDPFGFYVHVRGGIPIKVVQKDQVYEGVTPPITSYVSISGLEDPYIWVNSKERNSNVIFKSPYYEDSPYTGKDFHMDDVVDNPNARLYELWNYLNGTNNPSGITPRPYYFPDPHGLSFFDRLENNTNTTSSRPEVRMSTFVIG